MINLILADDHQVVIDGLKALLSRETDINVVAEANDGNTLLTLLGTKNELPLTVILDINMPSLDGIEAMKVIRTKYPGVRVLVLSMYNKPNLIKELMHCGVSGFVLKNAGRDELLKAIRTVAGGAEYFSAEVTRIIIGSFKAPTNGVIELTRREVEVLKLVARAFSTAEIAEKLFISTYTVDTHRKNLLSKLNLKNTASLVNYAIQNGYGEDKF